MQNKKLLAVVAFMLFLVAIPLMAYTCTDPNTPSSQDVQATQQAANSNATDRLHKVQPLKPLTNSMELHNQAQWYERLSDPNKIAYIYILNNDGSAAAIYQIRAKCSSTNSMYTTPSEVEYHSSTDGGNVVRPAPQPDGSYGQNEQAVFCFLNDAGQHMIEFSESFHYIWSEIPLDIHTTPQTIVVIPNGK